MKTKLFFLASFAFSLFCNAQNVTIPDAIFKSYLVSNSAINTNGDAQIQVSEAVAFTGTIDCSSKNIGSLTGIEAFVNLTKLSCFGNLLTNLDVTKNTKLTSIVCASNQLTSLDVTKNTALTTLVCENNVLTNLDVSKNTSLTSLDCGGNQLASLNVKSNSALEQLSLNNNPIATLDLTGNPSLMILNAIGATFTSIDLSKNTALLLLDFSNGKLTALDVSKIQMLELLIASNNQLTSVNLKNGNNAGISYLDLTGNTNLGCIQVDSVDDANSYTTLEYWVKDANATYNINCNATLGIGNISKNEVKIYPNPTRSFVNWSMTADAEVYNTVGQKVLISKNSSSVDFSKFLNGVYVVVLKDKNGKEIQRSKIIKN